MHLIFLFLSLGLLWLHLASAALLATHYLRLSPALNRAFGVVLPILLLFFVEHFIGLGKLDFLWPISSLVCAAYLYRQRAQFSQPEWRRAEIAFGLCFAWAFMWKFLFPSIFPTSERVTDLYFMANYYEGLRLPPPDHWFAGYRYDFYYAFQHYGASFMGRWFGWDIGFTYNIAFALLLSLSLALIWEFARRLLPQHALSRWLLVLAVMLGGTGVSPFLRLIVTPSPQAAATTVVSEEMWASARFIGNYDERVNTEFGRNWFARSKPAAAPSGEFQTRELPIENFGYQFYMGDYHPPLGGFLILFLVLGLMLHLLPNTEASTSSTSANSASLQRIPQALLAMCVPLMLITNTWILPMLAILLTSWVVWRYAQQQAPDWRALWAGLLLGLLLIYPFLQYFSIRTLSTPIRFVNPIDHTPLSAYLLVMWPLLILFVLAACEVRKQKFASLMLAAFLLMVIVGEFVFVDDPSAERFERTNTTMKWWGWLWSGGILGCGAIALASSVRWRKHLAQVVLVLLCTYGWNTAQFLVQGGANQIGKLQGKEWLTDDTPVGDTINYLRHAERGIVLENHLGDAYTNQTLYALFSNQRSLMGWPHHLNVWHPGQQQIWLLNEQVREFYRAEMAQPAAWLLQNQVRYVVWGRPEAALPQWEKLNQAIASQYAWRSFMQTDGSRIGVWERRERELKLDAAP